MPQSVRRLIDGGELVRAAGAHDALSAALVQRAGFEAVWASSFGISAARCLPDASLLTMTEYLEAAAHMQDVCDIPVVADCDTGFGNSLNVVHMVQQYERAGITAICIEDKVFPKLNSFIEGRQALADAPAFARKIQTAKRAASSEDLYLVARTEALIAGEGVFEALRRCHLYVDAGADAVLVHSKARTNAQILEFLGMWGGRAPVVILPTTYPRWHADDAHRAGVSMVIYANHALRSSVTAMTETLAAIREHGETTEVEDQIAPIDEIFELQRVDEWLTVLE